MRERYIIHLLDNEGKFIDEKEIFITESEEAKITICDSRIKDEYEKGEKKHEWHYYPNNINQSQNTFQFSSDCSRRQRRTFHKTDGIKRI